MENKSLTKECITHHACACIVKRLEDSEWALELIKEANKRVIPGEVDTIDALRAIVIDLVEENNAD